MTKSVPVFKLDGSRKGDIALPDAFDAPVRLDLVRKAFHVARNNRRQAYGTDPRAGKRKSVESWGPGSGVSRVPRLRGSRRGAFMPGSVGGRRAHPPKSERIWTRHINRKEKFAAFVAALAGTARRDLVDARGHLLAEGTAVPLVVDDKILSVKTTAELLTAFEKLGLSDDVTKAKDAVKVRAGKGKRRGRRLKRRRSLLLVLHEPGDVHKAARNLPGVDITTVKDLNVEGLAPGGDPGRLVVFSESAIAALATRGVTA